MLTILILTLLEKKRKVKNNSYEIVSWCVQMSFAGSFIQIKILPNPM